MKVLGEGELTKRLAVTAHSFSKSAVEKIEAAGGSVTWLKPPHEPKKRRHKKAKPSESAAPATEAAEETTDTEAEEPAAEAPAEAPTAAEETEES